MSIETHKIPAEPLVSWVGSHVPGVEGITPPVRLSWVTNPVGVGPNLLFEDRKVGREGAPSESPG